MDEIATCSVCNKEKKGSFKGICGACYMKKWRKKKKNGEPINASRRWILKEKEILIEHYPLTSWLDLLDLLPNRTEIAIRHKARALGVRRNILSSIQRKIRRFRHTKIMKRARLTEYKTAKFLWDNYQIVTFPSPKSIYDLLLVNGIKLEVKSKKNRYWKISSSQSEANHFCDFLILWADDKAFIIPYQYWTNQLGRKQNILLKDVIQYKGRWDLITKYYC